MIPRRKSDIFLTSVLCRIISKGLLDASVEDVAELAKQVWYGEDDVVLDLKRDLSSRKLGLEQKRRALYLIDRLRRYPCLTPSKATQLKELLMPYFFLKPVEQTPIAKGLIDSYRLDKLAFDWGLDEDISVQMKDVLQYQTRHFAATQGCSTGYDEVAKAVPDILAGPAVGFKS